MPQGDTNVNPVHLDRVREMLFASAAEGLVLVDRSGAIRMNNPRLLELFGYAEGELLGRSIELLLPESFRHAHASQREGYNARPAKRHMGRGRELNGLRKDGTIFPVEVGLNHFTVDDELYVMALVTDITERKSAEEALKRNTAELEKRVEERTAELAKGAHAVEIAYEREKELHALKSRFVSMASHEFRTPLSTIMGSADLIARYTEGPGNEKVHKHVQRIRTKVRDLTAILNDFLSFERIGQGDISTEPEEIDIIHLCIGLIEELRGMAKAGQALKYEHTSDTRTVVLDRNMLVNTITNLVTNAIKYSPEGSPVTLRTAMDDGCLRIVVIDKGIGIPVTDQPQLFDPFFRAQNVLTIQGTGLGLHLVKRYLDLMGGEINYTSTPGQGSTFNVRIPGKHYRT
ncbi:MAG: PAS domain-containing sensor histidine kinase [Flavobacteriales bacterium]|nr:PAS domain S-box protein [Flavobacteriales bacterium]